MEGSRDHREADAALDALERSGFCRGREWNAAHEIAQSHEGEPVFDRIHVLMHRIEGDDANARYWYRMAGSEPFAGSFSEEVAMIRQSLTF